MSVELPPGWDGRIYRRPSSPPSTLGHSSTGPTAQGATTRPVVHAANFPLPVEVADFGNGAVELMGPDNVLVVLFEYGPESATTALFAGGSKPRSLTVESFSPSTLHRTLPGQAGTQVFFSAAGRAFCLYVVLGSFADRERLVPVVNSVLQSLKIGP